MALALLEEHHALLMEQQKEETRLLASNKSSNVFKEMDAALFSTNLLHPEGEMEERKSMILRRAFGGANSRRS